MSAGSELAGKTAIVTGASSGIGSSIAAAFAREGANVSLSGRDEARLEAVARVVRAAGQEALVSAHDLTLDGEPARLVEESRGAFGDVNIVVQSAAIFETASLLETSLDSFDRQFGLNVRASFLLAQAAVPHMSAGDSLIFISSIAGHVAFPNSVAYCGTKGAVELMTKALCIELAPLGIRVNALAPGNIKTPMNASLRVQPGYEDASNELTPAGRFGEPGEIADAAVFLASNKAAYVHGVSLIVDGGWTVR